MVGQPPFAPEAVLRFDDNIAGSGRVPVAVHERTKNVRHQLEIRKDVEIKYVSFGDVDPAQFTLAAFGIPDMSVQRAPAARPLAIWWFLGLLGIALAGALYSIVSRRRQNLGPAPENPHGPKNI